MTPGVGPWGGSPGRLWIVTPGAGSGGVYNVGDPGSSPGMGRSPGEGNGNPLQYYCLENLMDRGAWYATVYGVEKSWTRLSNFTFTFTFSGPKRGVGLQDHMIPLCLVFLGNSMLFSIMASPFTFPPRPWEDLTGCTFSAVIILCRSFQ